METGRGMNQTKGPKGDGKNEVQNKKVERMVTGWIQNKKALNVNR
jgi:hypothetical protein